MKERLDFERVRDDPKCEEEGGRASPGASAWTSQGVYHASSADVTASTPLSVPEIPEQEDCSSDAVPQGTVNTALTNSAGKKKIYVPELITMNKVLFDRYRLEMYQFLNYSLRRGVLSEIVGQRVTTRKITHEQCNFTGVEFWRISREEFYADVTVELKLDTEAGQILWKGYLVCWCGFDEELFCSIEYLTDSAGAIAEKNKGLDLLSPYLIPYATNKRVDEISEEILERYQKEALTNPSARNAAKLAESMGLRIEYRPVYEHRNVDSILFFKAQPLEIGEDRIEKDEDGKKTHIKAPAGETVIIPANTIVVNTNRVKRDYSSFNIYHECSHYDGHYLFFSLQEMDSNDLRQVKVREVIVDADYEQKDAIYFMEKQANRGAYGLMAPATDTRRRITALLQEKGDYRHAGERYQAIGKKLGRELRLPDFRIRARMIQLGNIEAKGALNYVRRQPIRPFAFDKDSWREEQHTFVVEETTVNGLRRVNPDLDELMSSGRYVYADGHVVINDEKYVHTVKDNNEERLMLTPWAEAHVDDCCLRFVRMYVQQNVGRYVYGRMYYDEDYLKQTKFFLSDMVNSGQMDELDAKYEYKMNFPKEFDEALKMLRRKRGISMERMAELMCMDDSTFKRWLKDRSKYRNEDFLTMLCLILELPDWISILLFKRAGVQLDEDDRRQRAILHILRVQSAEGIKAANEYLKGNGLAPLSIG